MKGIHTRAERLTIVYGILCFVLILVVLQLWLLTATMNAYLGGHQSVVWPAAATSLACFGLNAGLIRYLGRMERETTDQEAPAVEARREAASAGQGTRD